MRPRGSARLVLSRSFQGEQVFLDRFRKHPFDVCYLFMSTHRLRFTPRWTEDLATTQRGQSEATRPHGPRPYGPINYQLFLKFPQPPAGKPTGSLGNSCTCRAYMCARKGTRALALRFIRRGCRLGQDRAWLLPLHTTRRNGVHGGTRWHDVTTGRLGIPSPRPRVRGFLKAVARRIARYCSQKSASLLLSRRTTAGC